MISIYSISVNDAAVTRFSVVALRVQSKTLSRGFLGPAVRPHFGIPS